MLNEEETLALIRLAKAGDQSAKETLLTHNTSLVKSILRRYLGKGVEYDDLYQLACMGFLKAITGFDETFGVRFSTYAVPMIAGEIKRFLRDDGSVKVSRVLKKTARDLNRYIETYAAEHGEQLVQRVRDALGRDLYPLRHGKVAHLPRRVYARIRPAAARDAGKKSEPLLQGAFQLPLHRTAVVLHLPAAEIRPVVADF